MVRTPASHVGNAGSTPAGVIHHQTGLIEALFRPFFNLSFSAWRRIRRKYADAPIPRFVDLRFITAGLMLSGLQRLQNSLFRDALNEVEIRRPIFILGHWRSGTTLLHELMALDGQLLSPTTFQCFNPQRFLLSGNPRHAEAERPTGDVVVTASSPQKEEFAFLCAGAVSPYEAFLFPEALRDVDKLCDPDVFDPADAKLWEVVVMGFLRAVLHAGGKDKRLLLKSPSNSMRVPRLRQLFPDAVFINLTREPQAVCASTVRMWETMWNRYAIGHPLNRPAIEEQVSSIHERLQTKLQKSARDMPTNRFATITYEELVADPANTIAKLYKMLELGDCAKLSPRYAEYIARAEARRERLKTAHDSLMT